MIESTSILDRFNSEANEKEDAKYQPDGEYKAFGVSRHAVSLNCVFKTGDQVAIAWSLYSDAKFDPSCGIELEFTHKIVKIKGQQLLALYHYLIGNRATFVAEADQPTAKLGANEQKCVVSELIIADPVSSNAS